VARFHPQGQVDEGCHKVLRCNEKKKKKSYSFGRLKKINKIFFSWKKINDEPSHHQMHLVNRKDTRGGCGKQNF
jgi:hypothetical protein